jgi:hypothetical protein
MTCGFGHRPYYFGFRNSDHNWLASHIPSVISNRQTSLDQSWEIRNNMGDVQSYESLILSNRQASIDQSWGFGHRPYYFGFRNSDHNWLA